MDELREEYTLLFNGVSETIEELEKTIQRLKVLQQAAENAFLENTEGARKTAKVKDNLIVLEQKNIAVVE